MLPMVFLTMYYFFIVLEGVLFLYIISAWFPSAWGVRLRALLYEVLCPVFTLIQMLLKHSIFKSNLGDFSPMIALLLFSYLQNFFYQLSGY